MELPDHPYFVGTQAHPCMTSRPLRPQQMFVGLVAAAKKRAYPDENFPTPAAAVEQLMRQWTLAAQEKAHGRRSRQKA